MGWTKLLLYLFMLRMSTAHMSRCAQVLTVGLSVPTKMPLSVEGFYPPPFTAYGFLRPKHGVAHIPKYWSCKGFRKLNQPFIGQTRLLALTLFHSVRDV